MRKRVLTIILLPLLICSGCVVRPVYYKPHYQGCELAWRKVDLTVEMQDLGYNTNSQGACTGSNNADCAAWFVAIHGLIGAGSVLVSGSIYVVGNTAHWLEYQGRCPQSTLNQALSAFSDEEESMTVEPTEP